MALLAVWEGISLPKEKAKPRQMSCKSVTAPIFCGERIDMDRYEISPQMEFYNTLGVEWPPI